MYGKIISLLIGIIIGIGFFFYNQSNITSKINKYSKIIQIEQDKKNQKLLKEESIKRMKKSKNIDKSIKIEKIIIYNHEQSYSNFYTTLLKNDYFLKIVNSSKYNKSKLQQDINSLKENIIQTYIYLEGYENTPIKIKNVPIGIDCSNLDILCIKNKNFNIADFTFNGKIIINNVNNNYNDNEIISVLSNIENFYKKK